MYYYESKITKEDINLQIYEYEGDKDELWNQFKHHHYLSADLNKACKIFVCYWNEVLVGFCSVLPMPSGNVKHGFRLHRLVILPDYQSLGFGTKFSDFVANYYLKNGLKYYVRSTHLRLRDYWDKSPYYVATSHNNKKGDLNSNFNNANYKNERICGSYEYMGKDFTKEHIDIRVDFTKDIDMNILREDLKYIQSLNKYYITVITGNVKEDNPIDDVCKELGIRTQLLYYRGKISSKYQNKNIVTKWNEDFSNKIRKFYK